MCIFQFYHFALYIWVCDLFSVNFCDSCEFSLWIYLFILHVHGPLFQPHLLKMLPFLPCTALAPLSNIVGYIYGVYFSTPCSLLLICLFILCPMSYCLDYCVSQQVLKLGSIIPPTLLFSFNIVMSILGQFWKVLFIYLLFLASSYKLQKQIVNIHKITSWDFNQDYI